MKALTRTALIAGALILLASAVCAQASCPCWGTNNSAAELEVRGATFAGGYFHAPNPLTLLQANSAWPSHGYLMAAWGPPVPASSPLQPVWNLGAHAIVVATLSLPTNAPDVAVGPLPPGLDVTLQLLVAPLPGAGAPLYAYSSACVRVIT